MSLSLLQGLCETDNSKENIGKQPHSKEAGAEGKREERGREGEEWRGRGAENKSHPQVPSLFNKIQPQVSTTSERTSQG